MTGIVAALPREVAGLVRGTSPDPLLRRTGVYLYRLPRAFVVCGGMGSARVLLAMKALLEASAVDTLVSTGLAGGCDPGLEVGSVVHAARVVDVRSGERFEGLGGDRTLATTPAIASVQEKLRLLASYGAAMVDMEAATVARMAQMRGLGFSAIKGISDAHDFELEALSRFASARGHFRTGAFALHTALRPHRWGAAMKLGSGSQKALRSLTEVLKEIAL